MKNFRIQMKSVGLILCLMLQIQIVSAQTITQNFPKQTLVSRLEKIATKSKQVIVYDPVALTGILVTALVSEKLTPELLIQKSLVNTGWTYKITSDKTIVIIKVVSPTNPHSTGIGSLSGFIVDDKGEPIIGATVRITGTGQGAITNVKGSYTLQAPAGETTIEVSSLSYQKKKITGVDIKPDKTVKLDITLSEDNKQLTEVTVTAQVQRALAAGMLLQQKAAIAMTDGISSEQIKKTSDNNVAQVLKRVTGVVIDQGKYVVIRGMSERYNNVQLNGSSLPSTEPNRRNFSFDIIPSNLVENVIIAKTFTPDMQGEFAGGMVNITTLSIPKERFFAVSTGLGANTNSTGKTFLGGKRLKGDYLLGNNSERNWFGRDWVNDTYNSYHDLRMGTMKDPAKIYEMNSKIPNHFGLYKYTGMPTQNYALTMAFPFDMGKGNHLGLVLSGTYRHEENTETTEKAYFRNGDQSDDGNTYKFVTAVGAVANFGWERQGQKITWSNMFNNRFTQTNISRVIQVTGNYDSGIERMDLEQYSSPVRNVLFQTRLDGEHKLFGNKLNFTWFADYNRLLREEHDDRMMKGILVYKSGESQPTLTADGEYLGSDWGLPHESIVNKGNGFIMYADLKENKKNVGGNLSFPFVVAGNKQTLKVGYWGTFRSARFEHQYMRPKYGDDSSYGSALTSLGLIETYDPSHFADGTMYYMVSGGNGSNVDYYDGKQTIHATYLMGEFSFLKKFQLIGGWRVEDAKMSVKKAYWAPIAYAYYDSTVVNNVTDILPSVTAIWNINPTLNLRAAYGETLARPDFRELTKYDYYNVSDRATISSFKALKQTYIYNTDIRLEWYPTPGEVLSLSVFYKKFIDPVEQVCYNPNSAGNYNFASYNLDQSTAKGVELNLRKSLKFIAPASFLKDLMISGNVTWLKGNVTYNPDKLSAIASGLSTENIQGGDRARPLQGQAPYIVNAGLSYTGKLLGAAMNYNINGRKLVLSAPVEMLDEYEAPRHVLDFQLSTRLFKNRLEIKANASDILNLPYIVYVNCDTHSTNLTDDMSYNKETDLVRSKIKKGTTYSISLSYKF